MAATDSAHAATSACSSTLQALTAAALLLPGLQCATAQSSEGTSVQIARFSEGTRNTSTATINNPLSAYTLDFHTTQTLSNGNSLHVGLMQDSWSGATPVAVAPVSFSGNRPVLRNSTAGVVISGASPLLNGTVQLDRHPQAVPGNANGNELIMSSASPEVRKQLDAGYDWREVGRAHSLSLSLSHEPDFRSWHAGTEHRIDFNRQQSSVSVGAGYTHSDVDATLDARFAPYVKFDAEDPSFKRQGGELKRSGVRSERALSLGLTHALTQIDLLDFNYSVNASAGLLSHPYKAVMVAFDPSSLSAANAQATVEAHALLEQRPASRLQQSASLRLVHAIESLNAALHAEISYSRDDWGIRSQSAALEWVQESGPWLIAPHLRWYSQTAASFHTDYLSTPQAYRSIARDAAGRELWRDINQSTAQYLRTTTGDFLDQQGRAIDASQLSLVPQFVSFSRSLLPATFSSDQRLGAFGTLSAGLSLRYRFSPVMTVQASIDYFRRASSLQWNGEGNTAYADQHYSSAALALQYAWEPWPATPAHVHDVQANSTFVAQLPSGLMHGHTPMPVQRLQTSYHLFSPDPDTTMHMLELSYGFNEHWQWMLMPEFMSLDRSTTDSTSSHALHSQAGTVHSSGPTQVSVVSVWQPNAASAPSQWLWSTALAIPLSNRETLALTPTLSHQSRSNDWFFGQQLETRYELEAHALQSHNPERQWLASAWWGRFLTQSVQVTLRGEYLQAHAQNLHWQRSAVGIGLALNLLGQALHIEWTQPVSSSALMPAEYEFGALSARWHMTL